MQRRGAAAGSGFGEYDIGPRRGGPAIVSHVHETLEHPAYNIAFCEVLEIGSPTPESFGVLTESPQFQTDDTHPLTTRRPREKEREEKD